jgi:hypothetical protein
MGLCDGNQDWGEQQAGASASAKMRRSVFVASRERYPLARQREHVLG